MEEVKAKASSSRSKKGEISDDLEFDEKEKREQQILINRFCTQT